MTAGRQLCVGIIALLLVTGPGFTAFAAENAAEGTFVIHQIAGNPSKASEVFAVTSNFGILKSEDAGLTWKTANHGIKSFTHHALAINPAKSPRLYVGGWGGGLSRSDDDGANWTEMNDQLGNTAVDAIAVDPGAPDRLYIATSTRFYRTDDGGNRWLPYGEGLPPFPGETKFKTLLLLPGTPKTLWLGTAQGLFYRAVDSPRWSEEDRFKNIRVSALACDEKLRRLWVGTLGQGLFVRREPEKDWSSIEIEKEAWINQIVLDPTDSGIIYVATRGKGIFKSTDGGKSWSPANTGLDDSDIRSLAIHPLNRSLLFAGTTAKGIYRSTDGGAHWSPSQPLPPLTISQIIEMLSIPSLPAARPAVPAAFSKCNGCHGWTDPALNQKKTYWRVPPNLRDWAETVVRMSERAHLTPDEISSVLKFLTSYSRKPSG
ncbi:MAG: hypothetical protein HY283_07570 [Nitrospirae bacterium]|nr:hypothetical protein [Nitrospirota bacterium]